ncbi:MAG: ATP-binding cassette domain-containing protein [Candidatus Merdivicinus sp.]|jgi:ABC-type lipoprotein export system ATPase subunit
MIQCENLVKIYKTGEIEVVALQGLDLTVEDGELMAIIGNSGSGKSTLLNMLGGLDVPSAGQLEVDGKNLLAFDKKQMMEYRRSTVGFVWQNPARNLIPYLTAQKNVELPILISRKKPADMPPLPAADGTPIVTKTAAERAAALLDLVELSHRRKSRLTELSGGEQQRVAIAIALASNPRLLLADEPTGAVDSKTTEDLLRLFQRLNQKLGITIVIVTHDRLVSSFVNRAVMIRDGRTSSEFIRRSLSLEGLDSLSSETEVPAESTEVEERTVVDKAGRVQLPREYLDELGITGRETMLTHLEDGKIILTPIPKTAQPDPSSESISAE